MANLVTLKNFTDRRGSLIALESYKEIPFTIRRIFYIYDVGADIVRGGHRHHRNTQALICVSGSCGIFVNDGSCSREFVLENPAQCLILDPRDWHTMHSFSADAVLLVLASEPYTVADYIDEEYP